MVELRPITEENFEAGKEKIENNTYTTPAALKINNHQTKHIFDFSMDQMIGNLFVKGYSQQEQLIDISKLQKIVGFYFYL